MRSANASFRTVLCRVICPNSHSFRGFARNALPCAHVIFDDGVTAVEPIFVPEALKYAPSCVALLARAYLVFRQPLINLIDIRIKFGPLYLRRPPIPRRLRIGQHLRNTVSADPKIPSNLTTAQPILKMGTAQPSNTIPPLSVMQASLAGQRVNISKPSHQMKGQSGRLLL